MATIAPVIVGTGDIKTVKFRWLGLANGDSGSPMELPAFADKSVQVTGVTLSASTAAAGNFGVTATRPRMTLPLNVANKTEQFDWAQLGLPEIYNSSCLFPIELCSTTTTGIVRGGAKIAHG